MPELPEVETIARDLDPVLRGRQIVEVVAEWPGALNGIPLLSFRQQAVGRRFESLRRRGKHIIAGLSGGLALVFHLKMTGQILYRSRGSPPDRFVRVSFLLDGGDELRFADTRKFGRIQLLDEAAVQHLDESLGDEPLGEELTLERFAHLLRGRSARIKSLLLDQRFLAGIGNIYADEALFQAGIHPLRPARTLSPTEIDRLYWAIRQVLRQGIENRGTTFSSYRDGLGEEGTNQHWLRVYRRHGQPCARCGGRLERIVVGGRGTHFCPKCQRGPNVR